jgi:hypothetical protein
LHSVATSMEHDNLLCLCRYCGDLWISTGFIRCPVCDSANIKVIPLRDHRYCTMSWVMHHGFPYINKCLEAEQVVERRYD